MYLTGQIAITRHAALLPGMSETQHDKILKTYSYFLLSFFSIIAVVQLQLFYD
ncbi:hypothetical protein M431DRAFT_505945 [Trichoderma harzianum CBS 226.95]|uniref:Uncharacterized protein n=1 Tax=Trichoderma harzianum CBS 226.95 TaxID=983964 RepID=A0A2T4AMY4_TRIHA|nr:hypothetical protein M431DRAFT_505945 [Trichoderma harzianum CBS 226.95]PTB58444.1 hypothetical protein M431DRAFT_505945 [Trichoderma harzianum CBS 226.95]